MQEIERREPSVPSPDGESSTRSGRRPEDRNPSVDTMRLIAIFAVICCHTEPFSPRRFAGYGPGWLELYQGISLATRFAVPYFFCISGYFWGRKIHRGASPDAATVARFKRVVKVFYFWSVFYVLQNHFLNLLSSHFPWVAKEAEAIPFSVLWVPRRLIAGGGAPHLWFLPVLLLTVVFCWIFVRFKQSKLLLATAIGLYIIGVLARAYSETAIGFSLQLAGHHFDARDGPCFASIFFATGYLLSARKPQRQWVSWGAILLSAGFLGHVTEIRLIHTLFHAPELPIGQQDFVFSTYAIGLGAALVALARPDWLTSATLARWGRSTLGIYCVHLFFVRRLVGIVDRFHSPAVEVLYPVVVLFLSLLTVNLLARIKPLRTLVT